jgi:prevent-host-death family protein
MSDRAYSYTDPMPADRSQPDDEVSTVDLRKNMAAVVDAAEKGKTTYITRRGRRIAAVVPLDQARSVPAALIDQLERLRGLVEDGTLTREEFETVKARLLADG